MPIAAAQSREALPDEFEDLFRDHYQLLYRTAYGITGNRHDAEDVLQSVTGKCQLSGNELTMNSTGRPRTKLSAEQAGDVLRLTDPTGQVTAYHRDAGGPWYERARIQRR